MEQWKIIQDFPAYEISNHGRVRKFTKGKFIFKALRPNLKRSGYVYADLRNKATRKNSLVHRLVAQAFIPNPDSKPQVNHKNFKVNDNRAENLEWCTPKENSAHTKSHGRTRGLKGEDSARAILNNDLVALIYLNCKLLRVSYNKAASMFGTNYSNVAHIMRGSRWGHVTKVLNQLHLDANTHQYTLEDLEAIHIKYKDYAG